MRAFFITLLFVFRGFSAIAGSIIMQTQDDYRDVEGYYWRDYTGIIPKDALAGGKNTNGNTTYIGQVLHRDKLVPAKIDPEENKVYYEWGFVEFVANKNIKILCTVHPEDFEWVSTGSGMINNIPEKYFVLGGYEEGVTILLGRKQLKNELAVGKVVFTKNQSTLNITKDGKSVQHNKFEVLTYKQISKTISENKNKKEEKITSIPNDNLELAYKQKAIIINVYNS